jgi:NAD-dependent dihydropyrimidine dehydrogenase PreA subunit
MPKLVEWNNCCGCGACAGICPKTAITMQPNNEGFLHPVIDSSLCIECGSCEKVCPGLSPAKSENNNPKAFIVQHKDDDIRYQSTSGGAFTAIAEEVIKRGGVVFGAVMTEDLKVRHEYVDSIEGIARFRNSKYVQSEIGDCFKDAKARLNSDQWVCFSGTPCQINGLYKYLGKDYENLIAVDVVCKSVPSPLVFQKYMEYKKQGEGNIMDVVFRDKKRGFLYCTMAHYLSHEKRNQGYDCYRRGSESDEWLRLFLSGRISRRSCMNCPFQTMERVGEFTLGDIWETGHAEFDDNKGSTLVHVWNKKAYAFLESIKENIRSAEYPIERSRGANRTNTMQICADRKKLFEDVSKLDSNAFFLKYAPYNTKIKLKQFGRYAIWRLHLHNAIRHAKHLIIHKR